MSLLIGSSNRRRSSVDVSGGLIHHWPMDFANVVWADATTEVKDVVGGLHGNATNMSTANSVDRGVGTPGEVVRFINSDNSRVDCGSSLILGSGRPHTVCFWSKFASLPSTTQYWISWDLKVSGLNGHNIRNSYTTNSSGYRFSTIASGATSLFQVGTNLGKDTAWHHMVYAYNGSGVDNFANHFLYVDNVAGTLASLTGPTSDSSTNNSIGARLDRVDSTFNGDLGRYRIYDHVISAEVRAALFNEMI